MVANGSVESWMSSVATKRSHREAQETRVLSMTQLVLSQCCLLHFGKDAVGICNVNTMEAGQELIGTYWTVFVTLWST